MTSEQHQFSNTWARGSDWWPIRKVGNAKWIVDNCGVWSLLGHIPAVFKTKRAATEFFEALAMERMREFRACGAPCESACTCVETHKRQSKAFSS